MWHYVFVMPHGDRASKQTIATSVTSISVVAAIAAAELDLDFSLQGRRSIHPTTCLPSLSFLLLLPFFLPLLVWVVASGDISSDAP